MSNEIKTGDSFSGHFHNGIRQSWTTGELVTETGEVIKANAGGGSFTVKDGTVVPSGS